MKIVKGDIWRLRKQDPDSYIVIPTNIGWKADFRNVMGAGIAKDAKSIFKDIEMEYGLHCYSHRQTAGCYVKSEDGYICLASKPLNIANPELSWQYNAMPWQIASSCGLLLHNYQDGLDSEILQNVNIYLPLIGCGNGKLDQSDVLPILKYYFYGLDNIKLVTRG